MPIKKSNPQGVVFKYCIASNKCQTAEISGKMHEIFQSVWQRTTCHRGFEPHELTDFETDIENNHVNTIYKLYFTTLRVRMKSGKRILVIIPPGSRIRCQPQ
jgi:hypothetical protein